VPEKLSFLFGLGNNSCCHMVHSLCSSSRTLSKLAQGVMLVNFIEKVPVSDFDWDTSYPSLEAWMSVCAFILCLCCPV
jgi:hypothetical protein